MMAKFVRMMEGNESPVAVFETEVYPEVLAWIEKGTIDISLSVESNDAFGKDFKVGVLQGIACAVLQETTPAVLELIDGLCTAHWLGRCFGREEGGDEKVNQFRELLKVS